MPTLVNVRTFAAGTDLSGVGNKIEIGAEVDEQEVTNWLSVDAAGVPWKELAGGLMSASVSAEGLWEAGDSAKVDDVMSASLGSRVPWAVSSTVAAAVGDTAYLINGLAKSYKFLGAVGDVAPWSAEFAGPLARGVVLHPPGTVRSASGSGTAVQMGAVPAGRRLCAQLQVLSVSGSATLAVSVQTDASAGFASPTTVGSFTAASAARGEHISCEGYGTDTWYRLSWTVTGTGSFLFVGAVGIG